MGYSRVILDIEGTVCPISFVKDQLFPFFLKALPQELKKYQFPLSFTRDDGNDAILPILLKFPKSALDSEDSLLNYINDLVAKDIKDPVLKQLQGFIWEQGYTTGSISAPLFSDAIESMQRWVQNDIPVYIYSSGSVKAQKLLFGNVESKSGNLDLNHLITDYFDTTNAGKKTDSSSYENIIKSIGSKADECLFLSDNPLEVKAALQSGLQSVIILKPGNYPLSKEDETTYTIVTDLLTL